MTPSKTYFEHTGSRHVYKIKTPDTYVVSAEVKAIGGDPLMQHDVRILDAETGEAIGGILKTDDKGVVRATVPKDGKYRIEIVEKEIEAVGLPVHPEPRHARLLARFTDPSGAPHTHAGIHIRFEDDDEETDATTDEDGRIDVPTRLGHHVLRFGDESFDAHPVLSDHAGREGAHSHFIVQGAPREDEAGEAGDPEARLARPDALPVHEGEEA